MEENREFYTHSKTINKMLILNGESLGRRQKDLNLKINEAAKNKLDVKQLQSDAKEFDADILFKIDVAAKTKDIDYFIKTLKCGDELYISRAVKKFIWIGDKEFENVINVNYLKQNVFPIMAARMKKKLLCTLQFYLKNDDIIIEFYNHCFENKLMNEASKYLLLASESFKLQVITEHKGLPNFNGYTRNRDYMKDFFKDSYTLLEEYIKIVSTDKFKENYKHAALTSCRHMYSQSEIKFLHLMETYKASPNLGKRTSKHILKKYKIRVLRYPEIYLNSLNKALTVKYSTVNDAKIYLIALYENYKSYEFVDYYRKYKYVIDIIPEGERFQYMKYTFHTKSPNEPFEMDRMFYDSKLYEMMTKTEREEWALRHIQSGDEILGSDNDYLWYQFVNFGVAFPAIKKYVELTPDRNNRLNILNVLIDSVTSQKDIEILLNHFYARHINEMQYCKEDFLNTLISKHDVLEFNKDCWTPLEKIFYSLDVFNKQNMHSTNWDYRHLALIYYIIHKEPMPDILYEYIDMDHFYLYRLKDLAKTPAQKQLTYDFLLKYFVKKLEHLKSKLYEDVKDEVLRLVGNVLSLLELYDKSEENVPEIIHNFVKIDPKGFESLEDILIRFGIIPKKEMVKKLEENDIKRYVKENVNMLVSEFPKIKEYINRRHAPITWVLRKLKIYFPTDFAQQFLNLLVECLSDDEILLRLVKTVVHGIYVLSDETFKINFLEKYKPTEEKIDHVNISVNLLNIQKAICGLVIYSRPLIPLQKILPFMVGDYIHFCLPILNSYRMKLPSPQLSEFVESLLDKPVSIQKHGIRLASECFTTEYFIEVINNAWEKTKNVSLRKVTYEKLFEKTVAESGENQIKVFELLKKFTSDLNEDDDDAVFDLMWSSRLPVEFNVELLTVGWNRISNFKIKAKNVNRLTSIVRAIRNKIDITPDEIINLILNPHMDEFLKFEEPPEKPHEVLELREELQSLMRTYVLYFKNNEQFQKRMQLISRIIENCLKLWNKKLKDKYIVKEFFYRFVSFLGKESVSCLTSYEFDAQYMRDINTMFDEILKQTKAALNDKETYLFIWELQLTILTIKTIAESIENDRPITQSALEESSKQAVEKLATVFAKLIKEYIDQGKYYSLFGESIRQSIRYKLNILIVTLIDYWQIDTDREDCLKFGKSEAMIVFCKKLLEYNNREFNLIVVKILDVYLYDYYKDEYINVLEILKSIDDGEIQEYVYHKFVYESCEAMFSYFSI